MKMRETTPEIPIISSDKGENGTKIYEMIGATTLPTRVPEVLADGTKIEGEILSKKALESMAKMINDTSKHGGKHGSYRTISLFHDRVYENNPALEEAGYVIPRAEVIALKDFPGNYGLKVPVEVNKMYTPSPRYPDYTPEKIEYKLDKNMLGLSIEFNNEKNQEKIIQDAGNKFRVVLDTHDFRGFGFARPDLIADTAAVRIREIYPKFENNQKGETHMAEENQDIASLQAKVRELGDKLEASIKENSDAKVRESLKQEMDKKMSVLGSRVSVILPSSIHNCLSFHLYITQDSFKFLKVTIPPVVING